MNPPPASTSSVPSCWICLDESPDESGRPLIRGCACRGSSGYFHASCFASFAGRKSDEIYEKRVSGRIRDFAAFERVWDFCANCGQMNSTDVDSAICEARFQYVQEKGYPETDTRYISALTHKGDVEHKSGDSEGAKRTYLRAIDIMRSNPFVMDRIIDGPIYMTRFLMSLSYIYQEDGNKLKEIECLQECCDVCHKYDFAANNNATLQTIAERALEKARNSAGGTDEGLSHETLDDIRSYYGEVTKKLGKDNELVFRMDLARSQAYVREGNLVEATKIIDKRYPDARRVLGPDHSITKMMTKILVGIEPFRDHVFQEASLNTFPESKSVDTRPFRGVLHNVKSDAVLNGKEVEILRATKDCSKYVVKLLDDTFETKIFKISSLKIKLANETKVECFGLVSARHLNGKTGMVKSYDADNNRYGVQFDDRRIESCLVKPDNLKVAF